MARRSSSARRLALIAIAGGLGAALAGVAARRGDVRLPGVADRLRRRGAQAERYRCTCGAKYRVSGVDRHRVYWREGAPESDPVLGDRCVQCDAALPAGHEVAAA